MDTERIIAEIESVERFSVPISDRLTQETILAANRRHERSKPTARGFGFGSESGFLPTRSPSDRSARNGELDLLAVSVPVSPMPSKCVDRSGSSNCLAAVWYAARDQILLASFDRNSLPVN